MSKTPADLLYGTLDILVLTALAGRPMHGFAIATWLHQHTGGSLAIADGALYKALHRLEAQGDVTGTWGMTENKRRAKSYRLTAVGRRRLRNETSAWQTYLKVVGRVLRTV